MRLPQNDIAYLVYLIKKQRRIPPRSNDGRWVKRTEATIRLKGTQEAIRRSQGLKRRNPDERFGGYWSKSTLRFHREGCRPINFGQREAWLRRPESCLAAGVYSRCEFRPGGR